MASQQLVEIVLKAQDQASAAAKKVDESIKNIGKSGSMLSKIPGFDTLKTKLGNVATTVDNKLGGALTKARNRMTSFGSTISNVGSSIKGKFSGAIDGVRNKLSGFTNGAKGAASSLSFLKGAAGMAVAMVGYDLVSSLVESTRASMNARQGIQAFGSRLNMSGQEVSTFQSELDKLQSTFKKVDMDVVGQQAMDMAYRLGLPKESLTQLTETSAIFTDAMQRNGRSAEDATLALADAMDGEFRRLKEIGISQEDLMNNGWSGDINDKTGLLNAMNKALKDQHYDELAKSVDTLDDAWQVLTITLSNLLESVLLPITPAIVGMINGIIGVIDGIKSAWNSLPDFAQLGIGIGVVVGALAVIAVVLWTTYIPAWIAAAAATWAALAPVLPIIIAVGAAIGLLVAAVFEVGKAFGWWSDINGMLDAIWAGIQRLWDAFINHPDVQGFIMGATNAWNALCSALQPVVDAIAEFFGIQMGGNFDIVAALIKGIGDAWAVLTAPIRIVIIYLEEMIGAFYRIATGQQDVQTAFATAWQNIVTRIWPIMNQLIQILGPVVQAFISAAIRAGAGFVRNILMYIATLPVRITVYLLMVNVRIIMAMAKWITTAAARARQFVLRIINVIRSLPALFLAALLRVVSAIVSAGHRWVQSAAAAARSVVTNVINRIRSLPGDVASALSGVASAFVRPFQDAWNRIQPILDSIKNGIAQIAGAAGGDAAGGDIPMAAGGDSDVSSLIGGNGEYTVEHDENITVDENITLTFDLKNVPGHIDERTLISMLNDKKVIKSIVENREFQRLDQKVKDRILAKTRRARGV
jgi:phage-related protein